MPVMRFDPFRDLMAIQERMNRLFETALSGTELGGESSLGTWMPVSDIVETDDALLVSCELPGLDRDQIDIHLAENVLTLTGDRKVDRDAESGQYHRIERSYGPFRRSFTLPVSVDAQAISALYELGILTITLPKRAENAPRKITVRVS